MRTICRCRDQEQSSHRESTQLWEVHMTRPKSPSSVYPQNSLSRRTALQALGAGAALGLAPGFVRYAQAQSSEPIRLGFQVHRTGIGAAYGRWYERTTNAALKIINAAGGIGGRPVEIIFE